MKTYLDKRKLEKRQRLLADLFSEPNFLESLLEQEAIRERIVDLVCSTEILSDVIQTSEAQKEVTLHKDVLDHILESDRGVTACFSGSYP